MPWQIEFRNIKVQTFKQQTIKRYSSKHKQVFPYNSFTFGWNISRDFETFSSLIVI